jgi:hypothetical protein
VLKNVTITADEKTLQWARRAAADKGVSVSKFVGQLLEQEMRRTDSYWVAYERWKKRKPVIADGKLPIRREEIYDRGK